jgi:glycosyltransferase involved in cell wall biosynthesis
MRVAFDGTPERLSGAGVGTYARELRAGLGAHPEITLIDVVHPSTGQGGAPRRIAAGLAREGWFYPRGLERAAAAVHADLIHTPASVPAISRRIPLVVTIHDAIPWRNPEWFTRANTTQQRLLVTHTAKRATRVITDSHASRDDLVELVGIDPERIDVIPLGVSPAFSPALRDTEWLRARYGVAGPIVLSVGTPEPRKNLAGTLAVFERVLQEIPEATLLLVGGAGWRSKELDAQIARAGASVIRAGRLSFEDLTRTYASADCLLFPSLREGFGFPPLEAMASGLPVVCSNRPSLPEVVGEAAQTSNPDDYGALAQSVVAVLSDDELSDDFTRRGQDHVTQFTWANTTKLTIESYRRALGAGGS